MTTILETTPMFEIRTFNVEISPSDHEAFCRILPSVFHMCDQLRDACCTTRLQHEDLDRVLGVLANFLPAGKFDELFDETDADDTLMFTALKIQADRHGHLGRHDRRSCWRALKSSPNPFIKPFSSYYSVSNRRKR